MTDHRALPAKMIDLIREGVPRNDLKDRGDRAVVGALVSAAMSAIQRGWPFHEWVAVLDDPLSKLGMQAKIDGRRWKSLSKSAHLRRLESAWERAEKSVAERPAADFFAKIPDEIAKIRSWIDEVPFSPNHRVLMLDAVEEAAQRPTLQPALAWRRTKERLEKRGIKLTGRQIKEDGYDELCAHGALTLVARGRPGRGGSSGKANVYRLPDADARALVLRVTGPDPHPVSLKRSKDQDPQAPTKKVDQDQTAPRSKDQDHQEGTTDMADDTRVRLTVEGATLEQVLAALQREGLAVSAADLPDNVVPIRREGEQA
jgi:hypothetical protein